MAGADEQGTQVPAASGRGGGRRLGHLGLLVACLIVLGGAAAYWILGTRGPSRDPLEFLPVSTRAAVAIDMRLESPGMRLALRHWSRADLRQLGSRGVEIGQKVLDGMGLELDMRKDVLPWFGGEVIAASVGDQGAPLGRDSLVLIARTTNARRARAAITKGVKPYTQDGYWRRFTERWQDEDITVWRDDKGEDQLAFLVRDGCLLLAKSPEAITMCLTAGANPEQRFVASPWYRDSVGTLSREAVAWAYIDVASAAHGARLAVAGVQQGWIGAAREYLRGNGGGKTEADLPPGGLAAGLVPASTGAELRLVYTRPKSEEAEAKPTQLARLASFVPKEAAAYLLVHRPDEWVKALTPAPSREAKPAGLFRPATAFSVPDMLRLSGFKQMPTELLVTVLPRGKGKRPGVVLGVPADQVTLPPRGLLRSVFRKVAVSGGFALLATDEEAMAQCQQAAARGGGVARAQPETRFVVYARPSDFAPKLMHITELRVEGRQTAAGGEGEVSLVVPPRYLLGE